MTDDLTKRGPRDCNRINVNEPWEVRYWCQHIGCTEAGLRQAVAAVGVMTDDVKRYFKSGEGMQRRGLMQ